MYHYNLAFVLVGMPDQVVSIFSHLLPLERFTHDVNGFASLADVPAGTEWPLNTFVILNDERGRPLQGRPHREGPRRPG